MSTTEHSRLPWRDDGYRIDDANGRLVEVMGHAGITNRPIIVTAVNSHATLLAAAKEALANMNDGRPDFHPSVRAVLEAAIAAAEEPAS